MSKIKTLGAALSAAVWLAAWSPPSAEALAWNRSAAEKLLRTADAAAVDKDIETGRTAPWIVRLKGPDGDVRAIFKHMDRRRPNPQAASWRYEMAAYTLAELLGLDIIPPTVERSIQGVPGALQLYVEGSLSERNRRRSELRPADEQAFRRALDEIRVFEILTGEECGSPDDTLIDKTTWKICRVDFSEAFSVDPALDAACPLERCPRRLYDHLARMSRSEIEKRLRPYLSDSEINSLCERKKRIVAGLTRLIKDKGDRVVLFEP
jgi:hypothetical protein